MAAQTDRTPAPARPAPPNPAQNAAKQQVIGNYQVLKTLGTGSFGKVKLATHITTGYKVAMKFISKRKVATPETQSRVTREIQYLTLLQHPHIIKLYDVLQTQESIVMVLEYLDTELFDYIVKTGKMAEDKARRFFQQIIAAVEYCHSNDIVHRDLKPENLLLDSNLNVKIADFGLSNVMRDGDFLKTSCGSPNYAAPEVITGKLYAGPEIDIWSCGVILFVLLCGRLPFDDDHIPALFKKIGKGDYHAPPYLSPEAKALIKRMLTVDPNSRAKLSEIRATPWFQQDLPAYLATPAPRRHQEGDDEEGEEPVSPTEPSAPPEGFEWVEGLGWVERSIVEDLATRIPGTDVEHLLQGIRSGEDRSLRIAYQLCRDNRQPGHSSLDANGNPLPPPGVGAPQPSHTPAQRAPSVRRPKPKPAEADPDMLPPRSSIRILPSSLPRTNEDSPVQLKNRVSPLKTGRDLAITPQPPIQPPPQAIGTSARSWAPRKRSKWHFGIRSKSPPAEVMLEIYRTLAAVGFEWKRKEEDWNAILDSPPSPSDARKARKDEEERSKKLQDLFFIQCRGVVDGVLIRMDLQLYTQDKEDDSYLVDFRSIGYRRLSPLPELAHTDSAVGSEEQALSDSESRGRAESSSTVAAEERDRIRQAIYQRLPAGMVTSPFMFFEMATRLISELAAPSSA